MSARPVVLSILSAIPPAAFCRFTLVSVLFAGSSLVGAPKTSLQFSVREHRPTTVSIRCRCVFCPLGTTLFIFFVRSHLVRWLAAARIKHIQLNRS